VCCGGSTTGFWEWQCLYNIRSANGLPPVPDLPVAEIALIVAGCLAVRLLSKEPFPDSD
jgi:hypothetical protein